MLVHLASRINSSWYLSFICFQQLRVLQKQILAIFFGQVVLYFLLFGVLDTNQYERFITKSSSTSQQSLLLRAVLL